MSNFVHAAGNTRIRLLRCLLSRKRIQENCTSIQTASIAEAKEHAKQIPRKNSGCTLHLVPGRWPDVCCRRASTELKRRTTNVARRRLLQRLVERAPRQPIYH